jgi:hypothetical protein
MQMSPLLEGVNENRRNLQDLSYDVEVMLILQILKVVYELHSYCKIYLGYAQAYPFYKYHGTHHQDLTSVQ